MVREMLVHLEHADPVLTPKDPFQLVVGKNFSFVLRILQVVSANVVPNLRHDLAARKRCASGDRREIRRGLNRAGQSAPCLTCALCHHGPPVVPLRDRAQSWAHCNALTEGNSAIFPLEWNNPVLSVVSDVGAAAELDA